MLLIIFLFMITMVVPIKAQAIEKCYVRGVLVPTSIDGSTLYIDSEYIDPDIHYANKQFANVLEINTDKIKTSQELAKCIMLVKNKFPKYSIDALYLKGKSFTVNGEPSEQVRFKFIFADVEEAHLGSAEIKSGILILNSKKVHINNPPVVGYSRLHVGRIYIEGDVDANFFEAAQGRLNEYNNVDDRTIKYYMTTTEKRTYTLPDDNKDTTINIYLKQPSIGYDTTINIKEKASGKVLVDSKVEDFEEPLCVGDPESPQKTRVLTIEQKKKEFICWLSLGGGNVVDDKQPTQYRYVMHYNDVIPTLPTVERKGYVFKGWKLGDKIVKSGDVFTSLAPLNFEAQWEAKKVNITLNYEDGVTKPSVVTTQYNGTYTLPTPKRKGYVFLGWMDKSKNTYAQKAETDFYTDVTLYAAWRKSTPDEIKKEKTTETTKTPAASNETAKTYSATIKAKKVKGAKGYQFQLCSTKKFKKKTGVTLLKKTSKKNKYTFKKLSKAGTYYYRSRSYKKKGSKNVYSAWSKAKKITVK